MGKLFNLAKNRLRYFRVRKYERVHVMDLIKFLFLWSAIGVIFFIFGVVFDTDLSAKGYAMILLSWSFCILLPLRLFALASLALVLFVYLYTYMIVFGVRLSFLFWGI